MRKFYTACFVFLGMVEILNTAPAYAHPVDAESSKVSKVSKAEKPKDAQTWLWQESVQYQDSHDPNTIEFVKASGVGKEVSVRYTNISFDTVFSTWKAGRALNLAYRPDTGTVLIDVQTNAWIPVDGGMTKHPIELITDTCIDKDSSTAGMVSCIAAEENLWDAELNVAYQELTKVLPKDAQKALKESQQAWLKFRDAQKQTISSIYGSMDGTMWRISAAAAVADLTKEQAQRLRGYMQDAQNHSADQ